MAVTGDKSRFRKPTTVAQLTEQLLPLAQRMLARPTTSGTRKRLPSLPSGIGGNTTGGGLPRGRMPSLPSQDRGQVYRTMPVPIRPALAGRRPTARTRTAPKRDISAPKASRQPTTVTSKRPIRTARTAGALAKRAVQRPPPAPPAGVRRMPLPPEAAQAWRGMQERRPAPAAPEKRPPRAVKKEKPRGAAKERALVKLRRLRERARARKGKKRSTSKRRRY